MNPNMTELVDEIVSLEQSINWDENSGYRMSGPDPKEIKRLAEARQELDTYVSTLEAFALFVTQQGILDSAWMPSSFKNSDLSQAVKKITDELTALEEQKQNEQTEKSS